MAEKDSENEQSQIEKTPALEWLAAAIGLILVVGTLGFLIYSAATEPDSPPQLIIREYSVSQNESGYLVNFSLYNDGARNAADVVVEGKITQGGEDLETSSVTVDYSPSHSKREGGLIFTKNPKDFEFQIRALGYMKP